MVSVLTCYRLFAPWLMISVAVLAIAGCQSDDLGTLEKKFSREDLNRQLTANSRMPAASRRIIDDSAKKHLSQK